MSGDVSFFMESLSTAFIRNRLGVSDCRRTSITYDPDQLFCFLYRNFYPSCRGIYRTSGMGFAQSRYDCLSSFFDRIEYISLSIVVFPQPLSPYIKTTLSSKDGVLNALFKKSYRPNKPSTQISLIEGQAVSPPELLFALTALIWSLCPSLYVRMVHCSPALMQSVFPPNRGSRHTSEAG
jgi:hypothetical protein